MNAVHPGLVAGTRLLEDVRGPFRAVVDLLGRTPDQGADTAGWLATAPEAASVSRRMFEKRKALRTPGQGSDPAARRRPWEERGAHELS